MLERVCGATSTTTMTDREKTESRSRDPITPLRDKLIIFEALLFTQQRIWLYGSGAVAAYVIGLVARFLTHSWIFQADDKPSCIDFSHFWVSGALAGSRDPALVYDFATFSVTRTDLGGIDVCMVMNDFVYPPTYLFFTYPLGLMPYVPAFSVWTVVTLLLYLGGHLPNFAASDRYFGGPFGIPRVLQFLSRAEWIPPRRVDGSVARLAGATASTIGDSSRAADV